MMAMSVTSCVTTGRDKPVVVDTSCDWVVPIWLDKSEVDVMTDGTLRQILSHNEAWKKKCNDKLDTK